MIWSASVLWEKVANFACGQAGRPVEKRHPFVYTEGGDFDGGEIEPIYVNRSKRHGSQYQLTWRGFRIREREGMSRAPSPRALRDAEHL